MFATHPSITTIGQTNPMTMLFFMLFVMITFGITYWASKRTKTAAEFYTAGNKITGFQNGLALAGDFLSAASFLGIVGLIAISGFDGFIYAIGWLVGWPILLFTLSEPIRNLGKFTFADVVACRMRQVPVRLASSVSSLLILTLYLIAQMVGSGHLIRLLFGISYFYAEIIVGMVMIGYVIFGGMIATTWVQVIKAILLLGGAFMLCLFVLEPFGFNPLALFSKAIQLHGEKILSPGGMFSNPFEALSLGMALMFGTAGMPHILMRFYTVPGAKEARNSVVYATWFIGFFYLCTFILGIGAMVFVGKDTILSFDKGGNMAAPLLAEIVGGVKFLGFISAVAFGTILAVVAGLTLTASAIVSHDIWGHVFRKGKVKEKEQLKVARLSSLGFGAIAICLGMLFGKQNVAFLVGLAFAIAASANFPALILSVFWKKATTEGMVASILVGSLSCLLLICFSPAVQKDLLGYPEAWFPLKNPALVSIPLSFLTGITVSLLVPNHKTREAFSHHEKRNLVGNLIPVEAE